MIHSIRVFLVGLTLTGICVHAAAEDVAVRRDVLAGVESARAPGPYVVVVDAGHGGKDRGTSGVGIAHEKDVVLAIARSTAAHLQDHPDVRVILTRDDDRFLTLDDRVRIARESRADLFVSIHANAAPNRNARGAEVYFLDLDGASDEAAAASADRENAALLVDSESAGRAGDDVLGILVDLRGTQALQRSAVFAEIALERMRVDGVVAGRSVKQANFAVLRTLSMPSVLVEAGFLTHRDEAALLATAEGQSRIGLSLARAVVEYLERMGERGKPKPLDALRVHTVQRGDTLWRLATGGGWTVERILAANALADARLRVGQRLLVPGDEGSGR